MFLNFNKKINYEFNEIESIFNFDLLNNDKLNIQIFSQEILNYLNLTDK